MQDSKKIEAWEVDWYVCREDDGEQKELWRQPRSIGPLHADHSHWGGWNIGGTSTTADVMVAAHAPAYHAAVERLRDALKEGWSQTSEAIDLLIKIHESASADPTLDFKRNLCIKCSYDWMNLRFDEHEVRCPNCGSGLVDIMVGPYGPAFYNVEDDEE